MKTTWFMRWCFAALLVVTLGCEQKAGNGPAPGNGSPPATTTSETDKPAASGTHAQPATGAPTTQPTDATAAEPPPPPGPPRVAMEIGLNGEKWGTIVLEMFPEQAPITVQNFLAYVDEGYYNGTIFHRVISDFMIQGGGFTALERPKEEGLNDPIKNESPQTPPNTRGTIAMARSGPHTATSQFFINVKDNAGLNHPSRFDQWGYAVFGKVVDGMDVVDRVKSVEVRLAPNGEMSVPVNPPVIMTAKRVEE
ncbi:MAG: hypothetical protein AMXMBFR13_44200 [Phycisphaerae bacterium]